MELELTIGGMHCHHCIHAVRRALSTIDGLEIRNVEIGRVRVRVVGAQPDEERLREALRDEGYDLERVGPAGT